MHSPFQATMSLLWGKLKDAVAKTVLALRTNLLHYNIYSYLGEGQGQGGSAERPLHAIPHTYLVVLISEKRRERHARKKREGRRAAQKRKPKVTCTRSRKSHTSIVGGGGVT